MKYFFTAAKVYQIMTVAKLFVDFLTTKGQFRPKTIIKKGKKDNIAISRNVQAHFPYTSARCERKEKVGRKPLRFLPTLLTLLILQSCV